MYSWIIEKFYCPYLQHAFSSFYKYTGQVFDIIVNFIHNLLLCSEINCNTFIIAVSSYGFIREKIQLDFWKWCLPEKYLNSFSKITSLGTFDSKGFTDFPTAIKLICVQIEHVEAVDLGSIIFMYFVSFICFYELKINRHKSKPTKLRSPFWHRLN